MTSDPNITNWLLITEQMQLGLAVWKSWLNSWENSPIKGHISTELFDAVLLDMHRAGLGTIINERNTRSLRRAVTGQELKL